MRIGIVVTDQACCAHAIGLIDGATARGWEFRCFLTDTGVNLLADPDFVERAKRHPDSVSLCEHSAERYALGQYDVKALSEIVVVGGQYQDAELVRKCDRVLVF